MPQTMGTIQYNVSEPCKCWSQLGWSVITCSWGFWASQVNIYVCVCVCACVRACARVRVRVRVCVCVCVCVITIAAGKAVKGCLLLWDNICDCLCLQLRIFLLFWREIYYYYYKDWDCNVCIHGLLEFLWAYYFTLYRKMLTMYATIFTFMALRVSDSTCSLFLIP
jgi:hypothetical protein